jgi:hypothetical protein
MARFNFEDWKFYEWLKGNVKTIKEIAKVGIPYLVSIFIVDPTWQQFLLTIVGKFILDSLEYWVKE